MQVRLRPVFRHDYFFTGQGLKCFEKIRNLAMSLKRTILCVDSVPADLTDFRKICRDCPYLVLTAQAWEDAMVMIEANPVHIVIVDVGLCGKDGQFLRDLRELHPCIVRVVSSQADTVENVLDPVVHGDAHRFLVKPWREQDVLVTIKQCVEHHDLLRENRDMVSHIREQNVALSRLNEQLEEEILKRTRSLELSQKLLDNLPVAVVGVSREGLIVSVNEAVKKHQDFFQEITVGSEMKDSLPLSVAKAVERTMDTGVGERFDVYDGRIRVRTAPVCDKADVNGCVLVLEEL